MKSVELFVGAGGLAIGTAKAGFEHELIIDRDKFACDTIRENQARGLDPLAKWRLLEMDVGDFDFTQLTEKIDLVAGGPPCQPFSLGGKHRGHLDRRDMFPQAIRAVRELRPRAFLFENVKGLTRPAFADYLEHVRLRLTHPDFLFRNGEKWTEHLHRLRKYDTRGRCDGLRYRVAVHVLNAADYGVPQRRQRVFIVGFRSDLETRWSVPKSTHSEDALLWNQWVVGDYWERRQAIAPEPPARARGRIRRLRNSNAQPPEKPWVTVWDALSDLPDPELDPRAVNIANHQFVPGARSYPGHTGSPFDEPAKTLKAGDHGVPGGENMLRRPDGSVRYFSVRESARLQTFPDEYMFHGTWTETMRQLGNAVPTALAEVVATSVRNGLEEMNGASTALQPARQGKSWGECREGASEPSRRTAAA